MKIRNFLRMKWGIYSLFIVLLIACGSVSRKIYPESSVKPAGNTIETRFTPPEGYTRVSCEENSFAHYLRTFPLLENGAQVYLYNGELKGRQDVHAAVLDIDVGEKDLQQCADAIMRLRAEYLYRQKQYEQIQFHFTNGFLATYEKWRKGYRIQVSGNTVTWSKSANPSDDYDIFKKYLVKVFTYAGTMSLSKELQKQTPENISIGDVFIKGGSPGHAVIVMDMAQNKNGKKCFLLAQSYMPAQQVHILKNPSDANGSAWYFDDFGETLVTPEWTFTKEQLMKF